MDWRIICAHGARRGQIRPGYAAEDCQAGPPPADTLAAPALDKESRDPELHFVHRPFRSHRDRLADLGGPKAFPGPGGGVGTDPPARLRLPGPQVGTGRALLLEAQRRLHRPALFQHRRREVHLRLARKCRPGVASGLPDPSGQALDGSRGSAGHRLRNRSRLHASPSRSCPPSSSSPPCSRSSITSASCRRWSCSSRRSWRRP